MTDRKVLAAGVTGSTIDAICCFTPALAILLGAVGLSVWLGWIDYVLLPALAVFLGITAYGFYLRRLRLASTCCDGEQTASKGKAVERSS